jgi:hypothetical protein
MEVQVFIFLIMTMEKDFWIECPVCRAQYKNWVGSTPCCGALAYIVNEQGDPTSWVSIYASLNGGPVQEARMIVPREKEITDGE